MMHKELLGTDRGDEFETRPYSLVNPGLGELFKKHGDLDGKLFHSSDKVTFTFVDEEEVVSLHFDKSRKTIFLKGHNVRNIELTPKQRGYLELFEEELAKNEKTGHFVRSYSDLLKTI